MHRFAVLRNEVGLLRKACENEIGLSKLNLARASSKSYEVFQRSLSGMHNTLAYPCHIEKQFNFLSRRAGIQSLPRVDQGKHFSTKSLLCSKEENVQKDEDSIKPLTQRQKLARIFAAYGTTAVVFHTSISLTSLGICYMIVSSGIDMVALLQKVGIASEAGLATGASTFVVAYACHKVFMPVRIFLTVTCTPVIVSKLRSLGILKAKVVSQKA